VLRFYGFPTPIPRKAMMEYWNGGNSNRNDGIILILCAFLFFDTDPDSDTDPDPPQIAGGQTPLLVPFPITYNR